MSEYFSAAECSETFERLRDVALNGGIRVLTQKDCAIAATEIGRLHDRIAALESELAQARAAVDSACRRMFEAQTDRLSFEVRMAGALKERDEARAECERLLEVLMQMIELAEYWFTRENRQGYSEQQYKAWHSLGFGSTAMRNARAAIDAARREGK